MQLFGGLRVTGPNAEIDRFPTRRSALLLARVALSRSGAVGRDELAEILWPDDYLDATRVRLRQELNRLRQGLGPAAEIVTSDRTWIRLNLSRAVVDAREFDRLTSALKDSADGRARLLHLYAGPLLPEQTEDWVLAERQEYQSRYLALLSEHIDSLFADHRNEEALTYALRAVRADPYHEPARIAAMRAFAVMGDIGGAIRQFVDFEKAVSREFGSRPSESMQALMGEIRANASARSHRPVATPEPSHRSPSLLPVYLDSTIGRSEDLARLTGWLGSDSPTRLITITGPGGVGKTRLAVAAAKELANAFSENVLFVDLSENQTGRSVLEQIRDIAGDPAVHARQETLPGFGSQRVLIVLDNAEHVLDEARQAAKSILVAHAGACILATSRRRLGIGGEQEMPLAPLSVPDLTLGASALGQSAAAELFIDRARAVRPGFSLSGTEIESLAMLLDRLDGLPLAIELAAARIGFLTMDQILEEIDDRFTFLVNRRADVGARQRSLRATIDWSFRGIDPSLREALELFAAFRGGWNIESARQASGRADIVDILHDLSERSLITRERTAQGTRFGMLETIREYLLSEMSADRLSEVRRIHARVISKITFACSRELTGPGQKDSYDTLRLELHNARAAIDWAAGHDEEISGRLGSSLWRYWCARGSPFEGAYLLDRLLAVQQGPPSRDWAETFLGRGAIAALLGDRSGASDWHARSVEAFERLELPSSISWALYNLAAAKLDEGKVAEAYELAKRSWDRVGEYNRALVKGVLALCEARLGQPEQAMASAEEGFAAVLGAATLEQSGRAFYSLADIYSQCGRYEGVRGLLIESVERLREAGIQNFLVDALLFLSLEEQRLGNAAKAEEIAAEASEIAAELGDARAKMILGSVAARRLAESGQIYDAVRTYEQCFAGKDELGSVITVLDVIRRLAHDLAKADLGRPASTILALERVYREKLACGLNVIEVAELAETTALVSVPSNAKSVEDCGELIRQVLLVLAQIRE